MKHLALLPCFLLPFLLTAQELRLTTEGLLGHDILVPEAKYHAIYNSSLEFPHIRLTEDQKDHARIILDNTFKPGALWMMEGYTGASAEGSNLRFFYEDGPISSYPLTMHGDGEVGINATNPLFNLDIRGLDNTDDGGELQLATPGETNFLRFFSGRLGDRNPFLAFADTDTFHLVSTSENWASFAQRLTVFPSGLIGINQKTPAGQLHILNNSSTSLPQLRLTENQDDFARIKLENISHQNAFWDIAGLADTIATDARLNFYFRNDSTFGDRMTILGDGRIGMGTTSPEADLHIRAPDNAYLSIEADPNDDAIVQLSDANATGVTDQWTIRRDGSDGGKLQWRHNNLARMTMTEGGALGIGTAAPISDLHLKSPSNTYFTIESDTDNDVILQLRDASANGPNDHWTIRRDGSDGGKLQWRHNNTARMTMTPSGFLGIGTAAPATDLHIKSPNFTYLTVESDTDNDAILQLRDATATGPDDHWTIRRDGSDAGAMKWRYNNITRLTLATSGNLGIGNTSDSRLTILGPDNNGSVAGLRIESLGNSQVMLLDGNEIDALGSSILNINANSGNAVTIGAHQVADGYMLSVAGKVIAEELRIQLIDNWPDYVFKDSYQLLPLDQLENSIKTHGHLPGIPDAATIESEGLDSGEMHRLAMEKIEELTLHIIELNKRIEQLESERK